MRAVGTAGRSDRTKRKTPQGIHHMSKLKPILITAVIAIVAVALFNRFAPASVKSALFGA